MGPLHAGDMGWSVTYLWHNVLFDLGWLGVYNSNNKIIIIIINPYIIIITDNNNNVLGDMKIPPS